MKSLLILALLIPAVVIADEKLISWDAVTEWVDDKPIEKLEFYSLYCDSLSEPIKIVDKTSHKIDLGVGNHVCYVTASAKFKDELRESFPSNVIEVEIYPTPKPTIIRITIIIE